MGGVGAVKHLHLFFCALIFKCAPYGAKIASTLSTLSTMFIFN